MRLFAVIVLGLIVLSGCAKPKGETALDEPASTPTLGGSLRLTVVDDEFQPVPRATVLLEPDNRSTLTRVDGIAEFHGLPPFKYAVTVTHPDYRPNTTKVDVRVNETSRAQVTLALVSRPFWTTGSAGVDGRCSSAIRVVALGEEGRCVAGSDVGILVPRNTSTLHGAVVWPSRIASRPDAMRFELRFDGPPGPPLLILEGRTPLEYALDEESIPLGILEQALMLRFFPMTAHSEDVQVLNAQEFSVEAYFRYLAPPVDS